MHRQTRCWLDLLTSIPCSEYQNSENASKVAVNSQSTECDAAKLAVFQSEHSRACVSNFYPTISACKITWVLKDSEGIVLWQSPAWLPRTLTG